MAGRTRSSRLFWLTWSSGHFPACFPISIRSRFVARRLRARGIIWSEYMGWTVETWDSTNLYTIFAVFKQLLLFSRLMRLQCFHRRVAVNPLALKLAPVAIGILFFYSSRSASPTGRISFSDLRWASRLPPLGSPLRAASIRACSSFCAAVTLWVGGFDVLYACQDIEYDQRAGLFSVPKRFGIAKALLIARGMHIGVIALLGWLAFSFGLPLARVGGHCGGRVAAGL